MRESAADPVLLLWSQPFMASWLSWVIWGAKSNVVTVNSGKGGTGWEFELWG